MEVVDYEMFAIYLLFCLFVMVPFSAIFSKKKLKVRNNVYIYVPPYVSTPLS